MGNTIHYRPTRAIVDLQAIRDNCRNIKKYVGDGTSVIAVVKADGYGHGEVEVARASLEAGATMVAVAIPEEAVRLRDAGITCEILVLGISPPSFAEKAAELAITLTAPSVAWMQLVLKDPGSSGNKLKVHVKIDTGMGRIGLRDADALKSLVSIIDQSDDVLLDGVYTHFARADEEDPHSTEEQFTKFMNLVGTLPEKPRLIHVSNSAAALLYPNYALDAVRFGISLYGMAPSVYVGKALPFPLERALTIETELSYVKLLEKGQRVSYGGLYESTEDEWIGTLPIGYADGLRRGLRGQEVLIGGERAPLVGTICMDQCMVRLPREMPIGEKVVLIGSQGDKEITMDEWAARLETITYEIAVSIAERVPRIYIGTE